MEKYELNKINSCLYNIQDKLDALKTEVLKGNPYKVYCLEKLEPIKNDVNCLISIFEGENDDNKL